MNCLRYYIMYNVFHMIFSLFTGIKMTINISDLLAVVLDYTWIRF